MQIYGVNFDLIELTRANAAVLFESTPMIENNANKRVNNAVTDC